MSLQDDLAGFKQRMSMLDPNKPITASDASVIADLLIKITQNSNDVVFNIGAPGIVNTTNVISIVQNGVTISWEGEVG